MLIAIALFPILLYVLLLSLRDCFSLIKWKMLFMCLAAGVVSGLITVLLCSKTDIVLTVGGLSLLPVFEELLKGCFMVWLVCSKRINFLAEAVIYGASVGCGFALLDNIFYLINNDPAVGAAIFRGFDCAFLHIGCTALVSALMLLAFSASRFLSIPLSMLSSIILHLVHNYIVETFVADGRLRFAVMMLITLLVFVSIFSILFNIWEKKIYGGMEHSLSSDIRTLTSIKSGNLSDTKVGNYLLGLKNKLKPEVFFDVMTYVELYLDLKIERQSMMLLSQAGFTTGETKEKKSIRDSKRIELKSLKKTIGKTGISVMSPLIKDDV